MNKELRTILILHGWGLRGNIYKNLQTLLEKEGYKVFVPDMPGFGDEPLTNSAMNLTDYVNFVKKYIVKKGLSEVIVIGHSFGGRVGLKLSYLYPRLVKTLVLTGVPVVRHINIKGKIVKFFLKNLIGLRPVFPVSLLKFGRKIIYRFIGEYDYYKAGNLKKTFQNIINEDISLYAAKLIMPVLLIWGEDDIFTPVSDVEKIKLIMPRVSSVILKSNGHRLPYENPKIFIEVMKQYI